MATQLVSIDDYLIDCSLSETHTYESDVTEYPVESGSNITDNIRPKPIVVEMECLVSNTPININIIRARGNIDEQRPTDDAYLLLQTIYEQRKTVSINTSLKTYENMALRNLTIPRGPALDELRFTATFIQVQTVENKRSIRVSNPIGTGKKRVSKPANDSAASQILIDPVLHYWFDPDIGLWRKSFIFAQWVDHETSNTISYTRHRFNLFRGAIAPASHKASGAWVPPLLLVPIQNCQLHDFSIKTPFDGLTRPFERQNTISGRSE